MKTLRTWRIWRMWLVALLAVLLPIRGAMAAAMVCPLGGTAKAHAHVIGSAPHARQAMHGAHHHATSMHGQAHDGDAACHLCATFCSAATPLPISVPAIPAPSFHGTVDYPDVHAPQPSFVSDGPERPPRSI